MRVLALLLCIVVLAMAAAAQSDEQTVKTHDAPMLRIVSVPMKVDRKKRKVSLAVEVENTGDKTIKAFAWEYRARGMVGGYDVRMAADMPEVSVVINRGERKTVVLLDNETGPLVFFQMPSREMVITGVTFDDDTSWKLKSGDDKKSPAVAAAQQPSNVP